MNKKIFSLLLISIFICFISGSIAAPKTFKLRFSTVSVPGDAHTEALYILKDTVEKLTNKQITIDVFHSGSLYGQGEDCNAVIRGDLEMCYMSAAWVADKVPEASMFTAGYIFKDYTHMTRVLNGEIGKKLFETIAKKINARPLAAFYLGTRHLNLRDIGRVVRRPEDLKGVKLRMPNTPAWLFLGKALGANPTPLAFGEVYLALKTGTIDGQENPLPTDYNAKFYEVTKYIILTGHLVDSVWPTINEKIWQDLGPDLQKKLLYAVNTARRYCDNTNLKREKELLDFFKQQGLIIIRPDVNAFREAVLKAYLENKDISGKWDMKLYEEVQALAK
jgi:tripartite ATP-independent transporter DctP family solute receptor